MFAFAGQASQYAGMGEGLAAQSALFDSEWRRIRARLWAGLPGGPDAALAPTDVRRTYREIFAVQWALARTLMAAGLQPDAVIGVSMGEMCAAAVAQLLPEADAVELVTTQARQIHRQCPEGGMLAVLGRPATALAGIAPEPLCGVAMVSRRHFVLGGDADGLRRLSRELGQRRVASFMLPVDRGFHSPAIDPAAAGLRAAGRYAAGPGLPFASCLTGDVTAAPLAADHMWAAIREPIRFVAAARALSRGRQLTWIDLGPGASVSTLLAHNRIAAAGVHTLLGARPAERLPERLPERAGPARAAGANGG